MITYFLPIVLGYKWQCHIRWVAGDALGFGGIAQVLIGVQVGVLHAQTGQVLQMVLEQVVEYLLRAQIVRLEWPIHCADHLLALVIQSLPHLNQLLAPQTPVAIFNFLVCQRQL